MSTVFSNTGLAARLASKRANISISLGFISSGSASASSSRNEAEPILKNMRFTPRAYSLLLTPHASEIASQNSDGVRALMLMPGTSRRTPLYRV